MQKLACTAPLEVSVGLKRAMVDSPMMFVATPLKEEAFRPSMLFFCRRPHPKLQFAMKATNAKGPTVGVEGDAAAHENPTVVAGAQYTLRLVPGVPKL